MKKNTNKPTFAQRAKSIMKKYPRAKFDSVEKEAMEQELDALIAEQEAMKQAMGVGAPEQQMELDTQQAMLEGSMEEPQMFKWGGDPNDPDKPNLLQRGLGMLSDAYNFIDTGGTGLPFGSITDPEIGTIYPNTGIAPVPGRGIRGNYAGNAKNISRAIPKQTFTKPPLANTSKPIPEGRTNNEALMDFYMNKLSEAPGQLSKQFPQGANTPIQYGYSGFPKQNYVDPKITVKWGSTYKPPIPEKVLPPRPVGYLDEISEGIAGNINMNNLIPWQNIGYGAAGVGGLGLVGAGIYGAATNPNRASNVQNVLASSPAMSTRNPTPVNTPIAASAAIPTPTVNRGYTPFLYGPESEGGPSIVTPITEQPKTTTTATKTSGTKPKASSKTTTPSASNPVVIPTPEEVAAMVPVQTTKPYSFDMSGLRFNPEAEEDLSGLNLTPKKFYSPTKSGWDKLKENEFLPSYVAAGAGILGNLGQMLMDKKPKDINFARYSPEEVDLSAQRLAAEREADLGRAVGRTTARNLGMGAGQAMSSIVSSESGVSRNLADALMKSRLAEETANVDARNRAGQFNAELGMKEQLMNTQQKEAWKERQREYLAGAVNVIPETMQDINKIKAQREYLKQMGISEEKALEWLSKKYPNYSIEQLKNGLASGTLFKK